MSALARSCDAAVVQAFLSSAPLSVAENFREVALLSAAECARAADTLLALREHWMRRTSALPFFTLGAASYIDAQGGIGAYRACVRRDDPLLSEQFGWIHARIADAIAAATGIPAYFRKKGGRPGFHIFLGHPAFRRPLASVHRDRQFLLLDWSPAEDPVPDAEPLSFTLPLALPASGGGLNVWPDAVDEEQAKAMTPQLHPYAVGQLTMHSGNLVHQIAPMPRMMPQDRRITIQGHAIRCRKGWSIYW